MVRRLGLGLRHLSLLTNVGKTAIISVLAGSVTYIAYATGREYIFKLGENIASNIFLSPKLGAIDFVAGSVVLLATACIYVPIYVILASMWGVIEDDEKLMVTNLTKRFWSKRYGKKTAETQN